MNRLPRNPPPLPGPARFYARALRTLAARDSTGRVTAAVNGYGDLTAIRTAPELCLLRA